MVKVLKQGHVNMKGVNVFRCSLVETSDDET
jgi:hypothetical protein